jgi:outer membrane protein assembly factor BamE (lipoprotein component of BamABCDE complex)
MGNAQAVTYKESGTISINSHRTMKKLSITSLFVTVALIALCGCATDQAQQSQTPAKPKPIKDTRAPEEKLKVGMTKDEVRTAIGNPKNVATNSDSSEIWTYSDTEMAFIPFYTLGGGKFHNIVVVFGTDGKVKSWSTNTSGVY